MKVLISEDQTQFQTLMKMMMYKWGYEADIVSNGLEAFNLAKENRYDICIMDLKMPIMDGFEATKKIRNELPFLPILALTGNPASEKDKCFEIGMDDYLKKPCNNSELKQKICELTLKPIKLIIDHNKLKIIKEMPMDQEELKRVIELDKKGLALLIIENGTQRFVVHKNIQNKMTHKLIGEGKEVFEFLDRGDNPANCHLYKCNLQTNRLLLTPEEFEKRLIVENSDIEKYTTVSDQKNSAEE